MVFEACCSLKNDTALAATKLQCKDAGQLRRLIHECEVLVASATQAPAVSVPAASAAPASTLCTVLPSTFNIGGPRLSDGGREKLVADFGKSYPGVVLHPDVLPSLSYLQLIQTQCTSKAFVWTPWTKILSEEASLAVSSRRAASRKRDFAEIIAHAAGIYDEEWDLELLGNPLKIQNLLTVRAHAYSLCNEGHLHSWMSYVHRFIFHYSKKPGNGFRFLSSEEAEVADKELMGEIFRMVHQAGIKLDDALTSVVREDLLRHKLTHVPQLLKANFNYKRDHPRDQPALKRRKGAGKFERKGAAATLPCFEWKNHGKCKFGSRCRFEHIDEKE